MNKTVKQRYVVYSGVDNLKGIANKIQINENNEGTYYDFEEAEKKYNDIANVLKRKAYVEEKLPVRYFAYILGYNDEGKWVTLRQQSFYSLEYCRERGIDYVTN